jgi:hypothetical protein
MVGSSLGEPAILNSVMNYFLKQYIKKILSWDEMLKTNWGTICTLVEMQAADGKKRKVQASDSKGLLRIIQSIPSPKAEPFKQWLAQVGSDRLDEIENPELAAWIIRLLPNKVEKLQVTREKHWN